MEFQTDTTYNQFIILIKVLLGVVLGLSQVFLAIRDTTISPFTYTGSGHIDVTGNQLSLKSPMQINGEIVLHPRNYDGAVFDSFSGTDGFAFRQNGINGGQPIAISNSSTKACNSFGDCSNPNFHNKASIHISILHSYTYVHIKPEIDSLFANVCIRNYSNKTDIGDLDIELSTLILNTCNTSDIYIYICSYIYIYIYIEEIAITLDFLIFKLILGN